MPLLKKLNQQILNNSSTLLICFIYTFVFIFAGNICKPINIKNGKVIRRRQRGRFVKFACTHGFLIAGERHSTCVRGEWDPPPPKCVRKFLPQ